MSEVNVIVRLYKNDQDFRTASAKGFPVTLDQIIEVEIDGRFERACWVRIASDINPENYGASDRMYCPLSAVDLCKMISMTEDQAKILEALDEIGDAVTAIAKRSETSGGGE